MPRVYSLFGVFLAQFHGYETYDLASEHTHNIIDMGVLYKKSKPSS